MVEHQPMPVAGYTAQSQAKIDLVNEGKQLEERVLRYMEKIAATIDPVDPPRYLAIGKTQMQGAWMWVFRSIFNPQRARLPEDKP